MNKFPTKDHNFSIKRKKLVEFINVYLKQILSEGGLGGHMSHLYEDTSLSFREIKEVFELATEGKLEQVTEKIDGQNIFFSYDLSGAGLRFARNQSHIKTNGMGARDIIEKWANIPHIQEAYHNSYVILENAMKILGKDKIQKIFGDNANIWYSAEIVYTNSPNVINYDRNTLAIHDSGTMYNEDGKPINEIDTRENFAILNSAIKNMQRQVAESGWTIMGPVVMQLQQATNVNAAKEASDKLDNELNKYNLNDSNTIGDYISSKFSFYAKVHAEVTDEEAKIFGDIFADSNMSGAQKKKAALVIKKTKQIEQLFLAKNRPKILKTLIKPLEMIVHEFAVEALDGVHSVIALHPAKEVKRLRAVVESEIEKIKATKDENALEKLGIQLEKLKSVDKITSSIEGIVFQYKGKTFKLTGNFAPINQLLGLLRY